MSEIPPDAASGELGEASGEVAAANLDAEARLDVEAEAEANLDPEAEAEL